MKSDMLHCKDDSNCKCQSLLTSDVLHFIEKLEENFGERRMELLQKRREKKIAGHSLPAFLKETVYMREEQWEPWTIPSVLMDRQLEITGGVENAMLLHGLDAGASTYIADLSAAGDAAIEGHMRINQMFRNMSDRNDFKKQETTLLMMKPREIEETENHMLFDAKGVSASFFDLGVYLFSNAEFLVKNGSGPYLFLPRVESHLEARLWNDIFVYAQNTLRLPLGTIKAAVSVESVSAAFEMTEMMFEMKEHFAGLHCCNFSENFELGDTEDDHEFILPDREAVLMLNPFLNVYAAGAKSEARYIFQKLMHEDRFSEFLTIQL